MVIKIVIIVSHNPMIPHRRTCEILSIDGDDVRMKHLNFNTHDYDPREMCSPSVLTVDIIIPAVFINSTHSWVRACCEAI